MRERAAHFREAEWARAFIGSLGVDLTSGRTSQHLESLAGVLTGCQDQLPPIASCGNVTQPLPVMTVEIARFGKARVHRLFTRSSDQTREDIIRNGIIVLPSGSFQRHSNIPINRG